MNLFYWSATKNFGDHLNPWLWNRLLPECFDDDPGTAFLGIGTILNDKHGFEKFARKVVMGSGVGYGRVPAIDDSWLFYCVRGPRSAEALRLSPDLAITDPGMLTRRFVKAESVRPTRKFGFMPHFHHNLGAWWCVCQDVGITYIDPQQDVDEVIDAILGCEVVLTEAMHGAIIADALGRPWVPVRIDQRILDLKWLDWCASVGLTYEPWQLPRLFELPEDNDFFLRQHTRVTRVIARRALRQVMRKAKPVLSDRSRLDQLEARLLGRIERFREDCAQGRFQQMAAMPC